MPKESLGRSKLDAVDVHVGRRVCLRRVELKIAQARLADRIGVSFQQIQKYERGLNRISASKLYDIARVLKVPMNYFFDGLADPTAECAEGYATPDTLVLAELLQEPDGLALARAFLRVPSRSIRKQLAKLLLTIADTPKPLAAWALHNEDGEAGYHYEPLPLSNG